MICTHCGANIPTRNLCRCIYCMRRFEGGPAASASLVLPTEPYTPKEFEAWCKRVGKTYQRAAWLLRMSRSGVVKLAYGECVPDMRTTLACFALERLGLE